MTKPTNKMFITTKRQYQKDKPGDTELRAWWSASYQYGLTENSSNYARNFIRAAATCSWYNKIIWLWPGLGAGSSSYSASMLVPLIDRKSKGSSIVSGSTTSFFWKEDVGLVRKDVVGNGGFLPNYKISDFASSVSGGLGVFAVSTIDGSPNSPLFAVVDNSGTVGEWTAVINSSGPSGSFGTQTIKTGYTGSIVNAGNYYVQRQSSTNLSAYKDGVKSSTNTTLDTRVNNKSYLDLCIFKRRDYTNATTWTEQASKGTIGAAYITDGTLTDSEVENFHYVLSTTLVSASGKI